MIYEKKLSDCIKKLMLQVMKQSTHVVQGFIFFRHRTIIKAHYDEEACDALLKTMVINKQNVLSYLNRKYIPTKLDDGLLFKDQNCIQKAIVKEDGTLFIHIKNSEAHKIITDTVHVMKLLREHGFAFKEEFKYYIEQIKIAFQDTMLYNLCLEEFGFKVPAPARIYERQLKAKYSKLEEIARIKKRSVKRKFCRWLVKIEQITWVQLRKLINMEAEDYTPVKIRRICNEIRDEQRAIGVKVQF